MPMAAPRPIAVPMLWLCLCIGCAYGYAYMAMRMAVRLCLLCINYVGIDIGIVHGYAK